jgi:hypothetical protein
MAMHGFASGLENTIVHIPPELRRTPRVAAFFDFVTGEIEALRPILTG